MTGVVCSVPHSGTRTLVEHLGLAGNSPRGHWLHFDYDDALLHQYPNLHLHIPVRDPMSVAASHARRGKNIDKLLRAYESMFAHLHRPYTAHQMEALPVLAGGDDHDRGRDGQLNVHEYQTTVLDKVVLPEQQWFSQFYELDSMTYTWRCRGCGEKVDVTRRMADHDVCPTYREHACSDGFTRVLVSPMAVHVHENESQYWKDDNYHD